MSDDILTPAQLAKELSVHRMTIQRWLEQGVFPEHTFWRVPEGRTVRFHKQAVLDHLFSSAPQSRKAVSKSETQGTAQEQLNMDLGEPVDPRSFYKPKR